MSCPGKNRFREKNELSRRRFLGSLSAAAAGMLVGGPLARKASATPRLSAKSIVSTAELFTYDRALVRATVSVTYVVFFTGNVDVAGFASKQIFTGNADLLPHDNFEITAAQCGTRHHEKVEPRQGFLLCIIFSEDQFPVSISRSVFHIPLPHRLEAQEVFSLQTG